MNIIVKPYGKTLCYCRPDTTWERENKDFYSPECIKEIHWAPILFVRICKAGKCIGKKFAPRYYDAFNFGALLYCHSEESSDIAFTSCTDHSSLLPAPLYNTEVLENYENIFEVKKDGLSIFNSIHHSSKADPIKEVIEDAVCRASQLTTLRTGDFIAIELTPETPLATREERETRLAATYCENELFDIKLIF